MAGDAAPNRRPARAGAGSAGMAERPVVPMKRVMTVEGRGLS